MNENPPRRFPGIPHRVAEAFWWLVPILFLILLYRKGLTTWFAADDFAWLSLLRQIDNFRDFLHEMFKPEAQGTIRFWSERGFYILFEKLFGLDNIPFRLCVFVTMAANVALVAWITLRITGSRIAGFLAPILWMVNSSLTLVMMWTAAWNEALCAFFLLSALALLIRYAETGRRSFWWWQLVVFILGFGALELNVVYPALAATYVLFIAQPSDRRKLLLSLIPLFCISCAYFFLHRAVAPFQSDGPYALAVDGRLFHTLWIYLQEAFLPRNWVNYGHSARSGLLVIWLIALPLAGFCMRQFALWRNRTSHAVAFCLGWFLCAIGPMVSLPSHITDYYVMIPLIGLAIAGAWGVSTAWRSGPAARLVALIPLVGYLVVMIPSTRRDVDWWADRFRPIPGLVLGVAAAHQAHPDKIIVLDGVTSTLYDDVVGASGFYPLGLDNVYLTPESRDSIHPLDNPKALARLVLEPAVMRQGITHDQVVVYSEVGDHLRNITRAYERSALEHLDDSEPRLIDMGNPLFGDILGPEWSPPESGLRWMPQKAVVRLAGPGSAVDRLVLEGYCPGLQLRGGPLHLNVTVDGISLAGAEISDADSDFRRLLVMPSSLIGKKVVQVEMSVDRTTQGPDGQQLGLLVRRISIQPE